MYYIGKYIEIIDKICSHKNPGKKAVQKLFYLIERKGVELDLDYKIHFFGPYSSRLDNSLYLMQSLDLIDINTEGRTHEIKILKENISDFEYDRLNPKEEVIVDFVLNNFATKSPLELEIISTLDYVALAESKKQKIDENEIINDVIEIKGSKFGKEQLEFGLEILKQYGYIY